MGEPSRAEQVVLEFMAASMSAWPTGDATQLARFFSADAEYRNGPMPPVKGRDAVVASMAEMMSIGGEVDAELRHLVSYGGVVMTERVDHVRLGEGTASLRIAGVFEVCDGAITAWRDYFDANEFSAQLTEHSDPESG